MTLRRKAKEKALEECRGIIKYLAIQTWKKLPRSTRESVDVEDLVQDGSLFVWHVVITRWDKRKGQKLTTYAYSLLKQHYINETLAAYTSKRLKKKIPQPEPVQTSLVWEAFEAYQALYLVASCELRSVLAVTVGSPQKETEIFTPKRFRTSGRKWNRIKEEFTEIVNALQEEGATLTLPDFVLLQKQGTNYLYQGN